ncbi:hypothetical protein GOP47_0005819 [Adiantum capillus-veneris]|uniref:Uncharacterized protein n=1 Tax=Adiantum capillus-veneris TaxID=13818 RepID=A0A9D4V5S7_ADICA|nr:hypothetical protein GOP47_0005819 [Adiantum capillus-veneris]
MSPPSGLVHPFNFDPHGLLPIMVKVHLLCQAHECFNSSEPNRIRQSLLNIVVHCDLHTCSTKYFDECKSMSLSKSSCEVCFKCGLHTRTSSLVFHDSLMFSPKA